MNAVYLLGSERSGSNLLRTLLGNHSQISAPIAPHFCDIFYNRFHNYFPLDESSKAVLLDDIETYINHDFNDWKLKLDPKKFQSCKSFIDFMHVVYSEKAGLENKLTYFSKDNHNHRYALGLIKDIPEIKFVYLYRDPRDQVASWLRTPIHLHTPYAAIKKWNNEQNEIFRLKKFYNIDFFSIKYEEFVDDTPKVISELLKYLNLKIEEACFNTKRDNNEAEKHPLWKNINKPVQKKNYGKYKNILSENSIELIESVAKNNMKRLGYTLETSANWKNKNSYFFRLSEKIRTKRSKFTNKNFLNEDMAVLKDKAKLINSIFSKFQK